VRSLLPNFGVGVQFLRLEAADLQRLEDVLAALQKGASLNATVVSTPADPQRALETVKSWFGEHDLLTRQEFLDLLKNTAPTRR